MRLRRNLRVGGERSGGVGGGARLVTVCSFRAPFVIVSQPPLLTVTEVIVSVTVLGSSDGTPATEIAKRIVEYLEGGRVEAAGRTPGRVVELPSPSGGTAAYYADSAGERPGRWALAPDHLVPGSEVDTKALAAYLAGLDPDTGAPLLEARGSSRRAERARERQPLPPIAQEWLTTSEAALVLRVTASYVRRAASKAAKAGAENAGGLRRRDDGAWELHRSLVEAIDEKRKVPRIVAGYDLTFSVPKSVSVLWAAGDEEARTAVLDALDEAVAAGLRYLDRHALSVRVQGESVPATGVVAADYLHATSRALEPQLHHHVVVANLATAPDGSTRALDARQLFRHAKTASYLAGAELRHQLTARLGITWTEVHHGIAEVEGVPRAAMEEMSTRSKEIADALAREGATSSRARQVAAWDTRAAKTHGVALDALFAEWDGRLTAAGYGPTERADVLDQVTSPGLFDEAEQAQSFAKLLRVDGITEHEPVFDRRDVVQRLSELAGERCSGDAIDALADAFLEQREVVALEPVANAPDAVLRRDDGRAIKAPSAPVYSTEAMLALERRALLAYSRGRRVEVGVVPEDVLARVLAEERFARLSEEQRAFVERLTTSGMRIQAGLGAAGTGKTTALSAAVAAWDAAGYRVLGAAVGGTQAVVLGEETGIEARTVASVLARTLEHGDTSLVDDRTVVLVDEASLLSTKDFVALARLVEEQGATLRLVGDPAQHGSVEAGGIFRYLVEHFADDTPALTHLYRQQGPEMEQVRTAVSELREGKVLQALERLAGDGRILEAESGEEAYEVLVDAWYGERQRRLADPSRRWSAMTAEHHVDRRELNRRARERLSADGSLHGPELTVSGCSFRAGDEVVARVAAWARRSRTSSQDRSTRYIVEIEHR